MISSLNFIPVAFIASIFPITSRLFLSSKDSLIFTCERSSKYLFLFGVFIGTIVTILSDEIVKFIFGEGYSESSIVLKIIVWAEVLFFVNFAFKNLLNSINKQIIVALQSALCMIFNILANLILIPGYSYLGASVVLLMTEFIAFVFLFVWIAMSEYRIPMLNVIKILLMIPIVSILISYQHNIVISITISLILYILLIYIFKIIDDIDVKLIKQILKSSNIYENEL